MSHIPPCRLLIVEDDATIVANLFAWFEAKGYVVDAAYDGRSALHRLSTDSFDVIVLDIGLPGVDGMTVLHRLRNELGLATPVLLLTARDTLADKLDGFSRGADDFVTKPFALAEVEARVLALRKRASGAVGNPVRQVGTLSLDIRQREVRVAGQLVRLTPKSVQLLDVMLRDPGRVVPRTELENALWGADVPERDALRSQLHLLRKALADAGFDGIETVHGVGVRVRVDAP